MPKDKPTIPPTYPCPRCGHPIFPKDGMCQGCGYDTQEQ